VKKVRWHPIKKTDSILSTVCLTVIRGKVRLSRVENFRMCRAGVSRPVGTSITLPFRTVLQILAKNNSPTNLQIHYTAKEKNYWRGNT
jgi:hypothetical protein